MFVVPKDWSWNSCRKVELKWNCEISWVEMLLKLKATSSKIEYLFFSLALSSMDFFSFPFFIFKARLLFSFDFNLKPFSIDSMAGSDINLTINGVPLIVKRSVSFNIEVSTFNACSWVNISHIFLTLIFLIIK